MLIILKNPLCSILVTRRVMSESDIWVIHRTDEAASWPSKFREGTQSLWEMEQNQNGLGDEDQFASGTSPGYGQRPKGLGEPLLHASVGLGLGVLRAQSGYLETPRGSGVCPTWAAADAGSPAKDWSPAQGSHRQESPLSRLARRRLPIPRRPLRRDPSAA